MSMKFALSAAAVACALTYSAATPAMAQQIPQQLINSQIDIEYQTPSNPSLAQVGERLKQHRVLERLKVFLAPLKLSRKINIQVAECGAITRDYKPQGPVTICYELVQEIEKIAAKAEADDRERVLVGAFIQAAFHEVAHAVFDVLQVPVWGRAQDAADRLAAFIMVQFGEDVAIQTIIGTAEFFQLSGKTWTGNTFAGVNSPAAQRFYNYLCIAYGGAPKSFDFLVNPKEREAPLLPNRRAERCPGEYDQVRMAFDLRIMPFVDPDILVKVRAIQWLGAGEQK